MESRESPVCSEESLTCNGRRILRTILPFWPASLIAIAAGLKARSLLRLESHSLIDLLSWPLVVGEVCLSAWLFSGIMFKFARYVGTIVSVGFAIVSLARMVSGMKTCGCFGELDVPPAAAFLVDLSLLGCVWYGIDRRPRGFRCNTLVVGIAAIILGLSIALGAFSNQGHLYLSRLITFFDPESRYVDVNTWVGKKIPLDLEISSEIKFCQGQWTAVLYQDSCMNCQKTMDLIVRAPHTRVLFIQFPPFSNKPHVVIDGECWVQFQNRQRWFIPLPQVLRLNDGVVQQVDGSSFFGPH